MRSPAGDPRAAEREDEQEGPLDREAARRGHQRRQPGGPQPGVVRRPGAAGDGDGLALLGAAGADRAHRAERALDGRGHVADARLRERREQPHPPGDADHQADRDPDAEQRHAQQRRVEQRHRDDGPGHDHRAAGELEQPRGDGGVQLGRVGADPREQVTGAAGVVLGDRQPQQVRRQPGARAEHDALGRALQQVALEAADQRAPHDAAQQQQDGPAGRTALADRVEHLAGEQRRRQREHRADHRQRGDEGERAPVRPQVRQQVPPGRPSSPRPDARCAAAAAPYGTWSAAVASAST